MAKNTESFDLQSLFIGAALGGAAVYFLRKEERPAGLVLSAERSFDATPSTTPIPPAIVYREIRSILANYPRVEGFRFSDPENQWLWLFIIQHALSTAPEQRIAAIAVSQNGQGVHGTVVAYPEFEETISLDGPNPVLRARELANSINRRLRGSGVLVLSSNSGRADNASWINPPSDDIERLLREKLPPYSPPAPRPENQRTVTGTFETSPVPRYKGKVPEKLLRYRPKV